MCPLVDPNRGEVCKDGDKCEYSHSPLEKLYHPSRYKVFACEYPDKVSCPRKNACSFYHSVAKRRNPITLKVAETPTFLSYAEPKAHCINIVTNYILMLKRKEGEKLNYKWTYVSLRRSDDPNPETRSDDGKNSTET